MKKFIKSILLFTIFAIFFYVFAVIIAGKFFPRRLVGNIIQKNSISAIDGSKRRFLNLKKHKNVDVMILGSSHAYRGYDNRIFAKAGFSSYNLGSSAQRLNVTEYLYRENVLNLKPKILIIDIFPILFDDSVEGLVNLIPLKYNDNDFRLLVGKSQNMLAINSLIYFNVFGNVKELKDPIKRKEVYIDGGYISNVKVAKYAGKYDHTTLKIEEENITALKNIVSDAEKRGIKVFLFQGPLPESKFHSFTNNKQIDSLMHSIGTYYNYNDVGFLSNDYFFDDLHINQKGVDVYNKWVIEKLRLENK